MFLLLFNIISVFICLKKTKNRDKITKNERNNKNTQVKICDDGPGFSEDITDFLGEPYIRSKNAVISSKSGLGLGTFIGKTLLERMKAKVEFGKSSKTKGAMVTIKWQTNNLLSI